MITVIFSLLIGLGSCVMEGGAKESAVTDSSFKNDKFYFNRYTKISEADGGIIISSDFHENGSIEIYGNVVKFKRTSETDIYMILDEGYNLNEQTYTFTCDRSIIEFSVLDKTMKINFMNSDDQEVYYIDSNIKTNW